MRLRGERVLVIGLTVAGLLCSGQLQLRASAYSDERPAATAESHHKADQERGCRNRSPTSRLPIPTRTISLAPRSRSAATATHSRSAPLTRIAPPKASTAFPRTMRYNSGAVYVYTARQQRLEAAGLPQGLEHGGRGRLNSETP